METFAAVEALTSYGAISCQLRKKGAISSLPSSTVYCLVATHTTPHSELRKTAIAAPPEQLATITKNGSQVTLPYVDIVVLGKMAQNQWAAGQVVARVVSPRPGSGG